MKNMKLDFKDENSFWIGCKSKDPKSGKERV